VKSVLIDSDVLIEVSRGRDPSLLEDWGRLANSDALIVISPVTVAELWHGVRNVEEKALADLLASLVCLPADAVVGRRAGDFLRRFHRSHGLELGDALIGAAAAVHAIPLWTRNRRHYPMEELAFYPQ